MEASPWQRLLLFVWAQLWSPETLWHGMQQWPLLTPQEGQSGPQTGGSHIPLCCAFIDGVSFALKSPSCTRVPAQGCRTLPRSLPAPECHGERLRWEALTSAGQERAHSIRWKKEEKGKDVLTLVHFWLNSGCLANPFLLSQGNTVLGMEREARCFHGHPAAPEVPLLRINYFRRMVCQDSSCRRYPFSVAGKL